ncbi:MAG: Phosphoribosylamine-glycine ligase protein, partial [Pseudomonadota bacterium]
MKVLVIGSGGREHAMAWCLAKSPRVEKIFVAPGNGGTATSSGGVAIQNVALDPVKNQDAVVDFVKEQQIGLTLVGPEAPLAAGIVDRLRKEGLAIFGPSQACARLESSKDFAKQFMRDHAIPTAQFQTFSDAESAKAYIRASGAPIVVKADGLAAGKGVVVAMTESEAITAVDAMLIDNKFGDA